MSWGTDSNITIDAYRKNTVGKDSYNYSVYAHDEGIVSLSGTENELAGGVFIAKTSDGMKGGSVTITSTETDNVVKGGVVAHDGGMAQLSAKQSNKIDSWFWANTDGKAKLFAQKENFIGNDIFSQNGGLVTVLAGEESTINENRVNIVQGKISASEPSPTDPTKKATVTMTSSGSNQILGKTDHYSIYSSANGQTYLTAGTDNLLNGAVNIYETSLLNLKALGINRIVARKISTKKDSWFAVFAGAQSKIDMDGEINEIDGNILLSAERGNVNTDALEQITGIGARFGGEITIKGNEGNVFSLAENGAHKKTLSGLIFDRNGMPSRTVGVYTVLADGENSIVNISTEKGENLISLYDKLYQPENGFNPNDPFGKLSGGDDSYAAQYVTTVVNAEYSGKISIEGDKNKVFYDESRSTVNGSTYQDYNTIAVQYIGLRTYNDGKLKMTARNGDNEVLITHGGIDTSGIYALWFGGAIELEALKGDNRIVVNPYSSTVIDEILDENPDFKSAIDSVVGHQRRTAAIRAQSLLPNMIPSGNDAISKVTLTGRNNYLYADMSGDYLSGIMAQQAGVVNLIATEGANQIVVGGQYPSSYNDGIESLAYGTVSLKAAKENNIIMMEPRDHRIPGEENIIFYGINSQSGGVDIEGNENNIYIQSNGIGYGIFGVSVVGAIDASMDVKLLARNGNNTIVARSSGNPNGNTSLLGIRQVGGTTIQVNAPVGNNIIYGQQKGIQAERGTIKVLTDAGTNKIQGEVGAVYAIATKRGENATILIDGETILQGPTAVYSTANEEEAKGDIRIHYKKHSFIDGTVVATKKSSVELSPQSMEDGLYFKGFANDGLLTVFYNNNLVLSPLAVTDFREEPSASPTFRMSYRAPANEEPDDDMMGNIHYTLTPTGVWEMPQQSSVTRLDGEGGIVYFPKTEGEGTGLHIGELAGSHTFAMDLSKDHPKTGDMLYIQKGTDDEQNIYIRNLSSLSAEMNPGDAVRFATVTESHDEFRDKKVMAKVARGVYNGKLTVEYRKEEADPDRGDDELYNGEVFDFATKPGNYNVYSRYIDGQEDPQNVYLVLGMTDDPTDETKTVVHSPHVARYLATDMDTYTKRKGYTQYFDPKIEEGSWLRFTHAHTDLPNLSGVAGNDYELGYSKLNEYTDLKRHRQSWSISYSKYKGGLMDGFWGNQTVRGLTFAFYDTSEYRKDFKDQKDVELWEKEEYKYRDSYLKLRRLSTDYDIIERTTGNKVSGDFKQWVVNWSHEYGYRKPISESFAIIPQAQLQLSYLGGASYKDSAGMDVRFGSDWSLIGRVGIDGEKKLDEEGNKTLHFKFNVYHEFLNGGNVTVQSYAAPGVDAGTYETRMEGNGTWYSLGLGYSKRVSDTKYFYIDVERVFGHHYGKSYNFRAGFSYKF